MTRRILHKIFMIFLLVWPLQAEGGELAGSAALVYSKYESEYNNIQLDANAFQQTYNLAYSMGGELANGRAGRYSIMLGGAFMAFDSEINGSERNDSFGKFLYSGNVVIAPGGLPFRFEAYARDFSPVSAEYLTASVNGSTSSNAIPWVIRSATDRVTGFTFLAGIQNGRYRGVYRDVLSLFPRLLIDYQERLVEDTESVIPTHTRDRNLAFVSLNKKKNWFHYRFRDYVDFLNPLDDFTKKEVILGTIDHEMRRGWINVTNWIKMSVDGKLAREEFEQNNKKSNRYAVNFFSRFIRRNYRVSGSLSYLRSNSISDHNVTLSKKLTVPIYATGNIDRNSDWRISLLSTLSKEMELQPTSSRESEKKFAITSTLNTNKQRPYQIGSNLHLSSTEWDYENRDEDPNTKERLFDIILKANSNPRYQKPDYYSARFNLGATKSEVGTDSNDSWRTQLSFSWSRSQSSGEAVGLSQSLSYSKSENNTTSASTTRFYKSFRTSSNLNHRVSAKFIISSDTEDDKKERVLEVEHALKYKKSRKVNIESNTSLRFSNIFSTIPNPFSTNYTRYNLGKQFLQHSTHLSYEMSRQLSSSGGIALLHARELEMGEDFTVYSIRQGLHYTWFTSNGIIRKLAELKEAIYYERGPKAWQRTFTLSGSYFPTKIFYLRSSLGYRQSSSGSDGLRAHLAAGFNWPKLRVGLTYDYRDAVSSGDIESTDRIVRLTFEKVI